MSHQLLELLLYQVFIYELKDVVALTDPNDAFDALVEYGILQLSQLGLEEQGQLIQTLLGIAILVLIIMLIHVLLKAIENDVYTLLLDYFLFIFVLYISINQVVKYEIVEWLENYRHQCFPLRGCKCFEG